MDVTYYTYKASLDVPGSPCVPADQRAAGSAPMAYPSPANESVTVRYALATAAHAGQLEVLNANGQVVQRQTLPAQAAGPHEATVPLRGLAGGFYMYRLVSDAGVQAGKFIKQ